MFTWVFFSVWLLHHFIRYTLINFQILEVIFFLFNFVFERVKYIHALNTLKVSNVLCSGTSFHLGPSSVILCSFTFFSTYYILQTLQISYRDLCFPFFKKSNCVIIHCVEVLQCVDTVPAAGLCVSLLLLKVVAQWLE